MLFTGIKRGVFTAFHVVDFRFIAELFQNHLLGVVALKVNSVPFDPLPVLHILQVLNKQFVLDRGVFTTAKFDSKEGELTLARVLESDDDVLNWLRPHPREFNITYNHGHIYEPDFVVETEHIIYLVEVKQFV
mgnify:CR=1 FL=1